jgi:hypothetical protein
MSSETNPETVLVVLDPYEIGWWVESTNDEIYGPVSRATLRRWLEEGTITSNTLVRHCTEPESRPVADQPGMSSGLTTEPGQSYESFLAAIIRQAEQTAPSSYRLLSQG